MGRPGAARHRPLKSVLEGHHQVTLFGSYPDHGKRAALALAKPPKQLQRFGCDGQHVALLALVRPDFLGRHARFFELHGAQVKARTAPGVVRQLGEGVGQPPRAHVVDGQDGVALAQRRAVVDDLLRAALDLGVAALHGVKIQLGRILARGHGAGRAAAHADAHAGAAQLHQQRTGGEFDLLRELRVNAAQAARNHDGLVVAARHTGHGLLVFAKVPRQVGAAELVVERSAAQRPLGHDLQRAGDVRRLAAFLVRRAAPQLGDGKTRQTRLGLGAAPGGALVADLAARAGGGAGKRRDGCGVVMRFHLHQHMLKNALFLIAVRAYSTCARCHFCYKSLNLVAFHH